MRRIGVKEGTVAVQRGRQVMPGLELRTAPRPETATWRRYLAGAKNAETLAPALTVIPHAAFPVHPPLQRTSFAPAAGLAERKSRWPADRKSVV